MGLAPQALATGDFDRDGRIDIAVADRNGQTIAILLNSSPRPGPTPDRDAGAVRRANGGATRGTRDTARRFRD